MGFVSRWQCRQHSVRQLMKWKREGLQTRSRINCQRLHQDQDQGSTSGTEKLFHWLGDKVQLYVTTPHTSWQLDVYFLYKSIVQYQMWPKNTLVSSLLRMLFLAATLFDTPRLFLQMSLFFLFFLLSLPLNLLFLPKTETFFFVLPFT